MMIAAIVDRVLPPEMSIDLMNVAFENPLKSNPADVYSFDVRVAYALLMTPLEFPIALVVSVV